MITIRRRSQDLSKRIWLQRDEKNNVVGAIQSERRPEVEGLDFSVVGEMVLAGVFADGDDRLLTFDDYGQLVKNEAHQSGPAPVVKPVTAPALVEHRGKQYGCALWAKNDKARLYVKTPKGNDLGYFDLKAGEYVAQNESYFSSEESEREFVEKVRQAASAIQL